MNQFLELFQQAYINLPNSVDHIRQLTEQVYNSYKNEDIAKSFYMFIDSIDDERVLDVLAKEWDITIYDTADGIDKKRLYVKEGFKLNINIGTKGAVEEGLKLRGHNAKVIEEPCNIELVYDGYADYDGIYTYGSIISPEFSWAFFGVLFDLEVSGTITAEELKVIDRIIKKYKGLYAVYHCLKMGYNFEDNVGFNINSEIESIGVNTSFNEFGLDTICYDGTFTYGDTTGLAYNNNLIDETVVITVI